MKHRTESVPYEHLDVGATERLLLRVDQTALDALALAGGDVDALHLHPAHQASRAGAVAGVGSDALLLGLLHHRLPGPGTVVLAQSLRYAGYVRVGDELAVSVTVREKHSEGQLVTFDCRVDRADEVLVSGTITVRAPDQPVPFGQLATPDVVLRRTDKYARLLEACAHFDPVECAVVHPCDHDSLQGAMEAARLGLIRPLLVGPEAKIRSVADAGQIDLSNCTLIPTEHSHAAAEKAVAMARTGAVHGLMKGSLHTDELMAAVVSASDGLRTARRVSHVFVMDVPTYPKALYITDAAINIAPTLEDKADIVSNAIELAHVLGTPEPKVALLSAVETVTARIPSTLDAAALCKMADRGQIRGALLDGPLAFDNAISEEAARTKGIASPVAGQADILLVPDLEAGNMLAKQLTYLAGADSAGIVLGARVPIVLTSRADSVRTRLASAAVMVLIAHRRQAGNAT